MATSSLDFSSYIFECCCGERFNNVRAASTCKKCRNYSVWGYTKHVINTETGDVVHGSLPTTAEYEAQEALAEKQWAEEQAEWQQQQDEEYRYWEAAQKEKAETAAKAAVEAEEDHLYLLQDKMMGLV